MGAKHEVIFKFKTSTKDLLEKAVEILNDIFRDEEFSVGEYIFGHVIEPDYLIIDECEIEDLEFAAKSLSSIGIEGYIDILFWPYDMEYIHLLGDGNYTFGKYIRKPIDISQD